MDGMSSFLCVSGVFFHRKGDPAAEQRRLLRERERIERRLAEVESIERRRRGDRPASYGCGDAPRRSNLLTEPLPNVRHVSWSDGYNAGTSSDSLDSPSSTMPARITFKRRNAMGHKAHRKSLMQGILSVASGEGKTPTIELKEGKRLPDYLTTRSDSVYDLPKCSYKALPDPDEYYEKDTYIVVNKQGTIFRFSDAKSLFLFSKESRLRQAAINLVIRPMFSHFIMLVILANCFCMMLAEPPPWVENTLEYVFTGIYCFEALVKIIGRGFVLHRFSYLRDPWNWLDFVVIVSAVGTEILKAVVSDQHLGQFSVLRAFRVLRALKTMSVVPGLRGIVKALLRSIRALKDVVILTIFCVSVFALVGYQLFHGTLRNKCVLEPGTLERGPEALYLSMCSESFPDTISPVNTTNIKWTIEGGGTNCSQFQEQIADLSFVPVPLYNTKSRQMPALASSRDTMQPWHAEDGDFVRYILSVSNDSRLISTDNSSITPLDDSCENLSKECDSFDAITVNLTSNSTFLRRAMNLLTAKGEPKRPWTCWFGNSSENLSPAEIFDYADFMGEHAARNSTAVAFCNVMVEAYSVDINCLYGKLGLERVKNSSLSDLPSNNCTKNNTLAKLLLFGEEEVERWYFKETILNFWLLPVERDINGTSEYSSAVESRQRFFQSGSFLLFQDYLSWQMDENMKKEWDCDASTYYMTDSNFGLFFFINSSNMPGHEPQYCIQGDKNGTTACPAGYFCRPVGGNPDFGYTNFDDFFWAFLTSFRLIAQDAWSRLYYLTLHTSGKLYVIFYIIILFLGSYYLINLILAVVYMAYEEQQADVEDEEMEEEEREAEKREIEAAEIELVKMHDDDKSTTTRSAGFAPEHHRVDLITTSLTSISDAGLVRHRRNSTRSSRYGHRRPTPKVDPDSELLYRKYTKKYGDGTSNERINNIAFGSDGYVARYHYGMPRRRRDSFASERSNTTGSESGELFRCNSQDRHFGMIRSRQRGKRLGNVHLHPGLRKLPASLDEEVLCWDRKVPERADGSPHEQPVIFIDAPQSPTPVGACLKPSELDILTVDFERGRSGSIYSSASDCSYRRADGGAVRYCEDCMQKQNLQATTSSASPSVLHASSLRECGGAGSPYEGTFLPIPNGRRSRLSSTSSNSASIDVREQVVQAEISPSSRWLTPVLPEATAQNRSDGICSPNSNSPLTPSDVKPKGSPSHLQVPCLMVTSASSEHIPSMPDKNSDRGEESRLFVTEDSCTPPDAAALSRVSASHSLCLPGITEHVSQSADELSQQNGSQLRSGRTKDGLQRQLSCDVPGFRNELKSEIVSLLAKNNGHASDIVTADSGSLRAVAFNEDVESYEMPLINGYQDKGQNLAVAEVETVVPKKRKHKSLDRVMQRKYRNFKRSFSNICCKWTCCPPKWLGLQRVVKGAVLDPFMDLFITLCIFFNTIFMMLEWHPMDYSHQRLLEEANLVFTIIFSLEMFLKVVGLGPHTYFREPWNVFDSIVVISSLLELALKEVQGLSVLRTFRLLRILKLAKSWPTLNKLLRIIGRTLGKLWHLTLVFLLVLFIFAVVGMQLLRESYKETYQDNLPRWNFVDFPHAFLVVFRIQCGEWIENMFTCMNVASSGICIPLFILVLVIGNLVILNLFLALLLNSFSGDALQRTDTERNSLAEAWHRIVGWFRKAKRAVGLSNLQLCLREQTQTPCNGGATELQVIRKKKKRKRSLKLQALPDPSTEATMLPNEEMTIHSDNNNYDHVKGNLVGKSLLDTDIEDGAALQMREQADCLVPVKADSNPSQSNRDESISSASLKQKQRRVYHPDGRLSNHETHHQRARTSRHRSGSLSYDRTFRCSACHREYVAPRPDSRRLRARRREGFVPASAFQNRRSEEEECAETASPKIAESSKPPSFHAVVQEAIEQDRRNALANVGKPRRKQSDGAEARAAASRQDFVAAKPQTRRRSDIRSSSSHPEANGPDVIACNQVVSRPPSLKNSSFHDGSFKSSRKGTVGSRSRGNRHSTSSTKSIRSSSSNVDNASTSSKKENKEAEVKEANIHECFPPCWRDKSETSRWWKVRTFFHKIATHGIFENVVIFFILLSSVALAFEDIHLDSNIAMKQFLNVMDKFFCLFFTVEMLIKWFGYGLRYYFTNAWCLLDFVIVFVSLVDISLTLSGTESSELGVLRVLRTFRALRPLRALSRFQGMKVVVDALVRAIPSIGHVFLVCMIVWLIFSILGVNLFGGRFGRCVMMNDSYWIIMPRPNDAANETLSLAEMCSPNISFPVSWDDIPMVRNKSECLQCKELMDNSTHIRWDIPTMNFDNVLHGFLALMQVATFKGWLEIMASATDIDGNGVEQQPSYEASFYNYGYFCIFIVFGAFFSLNLFIGVIIDNFNQQKVKCAGGEDGVFLTDEQKRYYNAMKKMASKTPSKPIPRPTSRFANKVYDIVTDRKFEIAVMGMILLNMVVMAVEYHDMSKDMDTVLQDFNLFFICIFVLEAILKLIGLRLYYFTVAWNVFDIIVVMVSLIASALSDMIKQYFVQPTLFRIIRLFRVTRILRLIREAKGIRTLLFALMMSMPALFNIGSLLFLVIFIYAILGMSQFAYVQKIAGINNMLNFETFPNSFLVLFQISTSEGWNTFIDPIIRDEPPLCNRSIPTPGGNGDCGNSTVGIIYFVTFVFMTFLIVINMYIAIILENFEVATRESSEPLTADDFEQFFEVWQRYDDRLSQFVTYDQLQHFLHQLDFPLRVPFPNSAFIAHARMRITPDGRVHCLEVIIALIKKVLGDSPELNNFKEAMLQSFMLKCRSKEIPGQDDTIDTMEFVRRRRAAIIIQRAYRLYKCDMLQDGNIEDTSGDDMDSGSELDPD